MQLLLVKTVQASHQAGGGMVLDTFLQKSGGSDVEISS
jgi:hypothetical protein